MKKPFKVLCLFDYNAFTGFATVSKNVKKELKNHFGSDLQLDICAVNYFGEPYREDDGTYVISAVKSATKKDDFGRFGFLKILNDADEYDGIFIIQDLGVICPITGLLKSIKDNKARNNKKKFKSIFYFPVDCRLVDKLVEGLEVFDCICTYTEYGRDEVLRLRPELKGKLKVVPHGNNPKDFYPIESKSEVRSFREEYFGKDNADKFIITNVNRNQPRKDIPSTIFAFIELKKEWEQHKLPSSPFLYLHMNPKDPMGWDLRGIFLQTDLVEDVDYKLLEMELANKGASIPMLNNIYNASDVYLTTTLGEGWGLTLTEAMATKLPIICPYATSFMEMTNYGKNAYTIENLLPICNMDNVIRSQSDLYEVVDTLLHIAKGRLESVVDDGFEDNYKKRIDSAYNYVQALSWKEVCKTWINYFKETY
jgi:glycosyltransferase involved in cell wall biosynthesis